jgi:hypothetical protein
VRLVCFSDIHMAFKAIERLGPTLRDADSMRSGSFALAC